MKIYFINLIVTLILAYFSGCGELSVTGSDDVDEIKNVEFKVLEKQVTEFTLIAKGTIKNNGNSKISPEWYIEGDFYMDNAYLFKLGGKSRQFNYSLDKGETTQWTLSFSSQEYNELDYPNFGIKNLRAYYK